MCACTMHLELVSGDTITSVSIHVISSVGSEYKTIIKHSINLSFFMILFRFSFRPQNEKRRNILVFIFLLLRKICNVMHIISEQNIIQYTKPFIMSHFSTKMNFENKTSLLCIRCQIGFQSRSTKVKMLTKIFLIFYTKLS